MSQKTKSVGGGKKGHAPTRGDFAKYLAAENPNTPADRLAGRYKEYWDADRGKDSLPRVEGEPCVECGGPTHYTEEYGVARCDRCGIYNVDKGHYEGATDFMDKVLKE